MNFEFITIQTIQIYYYTLMSYDRPKSVQRVIDF